MDLSGQSKINHEYSVDNQTGVATVTFKDDSDNVLGTVQIEEMRLRAFIESLAFVQKEFYGDLTQNLQEAKTTLRVNEDKAVTEF